MKRSEFLEQVAHFVKMAWEFCLKARREGFLALEDVINSTKGSRIWQIGMRLTVDGVDVEIIDKLLSNMICLEQDEMAKRLKVMQKDVVLSIRNGDNPRILMLWLASQIDEEEMEAIGEMIKDSEFYEDSGWGNRS